MAAIGILFIFSELLPNFTHQLYNFRLRSGDIFFLDTNKDENVTLRQYSRYAHVLGKKGLIFDHFLNVVQIFKDNSVVQF